MTSNSLTLSFSVPDMTCGHCVRTITAAVESAFPGASVSADTATHMVEVSGTLDADAVAAVIAAAGYTPFSAA
ncbi:MAG: heavy-metal-associated domain-containing protein [Shinella sp.]|nr:heavy-metal-associated domain-containing protein [Shinella sp.]